MIKFTIEYLAQPQPILQDWGGSTQLTKPILTFLWKGYINESPTFHQHMNLTFSHPSIEVTNGVFV